MILLLAASAVAVPSAGPLAAQAALHPWGRGASVATLMEPASTTLADRLRAFGPEGKHMNPDFTVSEDPSLPKLHVRDTMTYSSTGNVTSDTIVIFQHTTGEYSGVPGFFNVLNGWNPPFYAVQLDRPGDLTTAPFPCYSEGLNTVEPCAPLEFPNLADCTPAHIETLRWFNDAIMFLAADYKNVILAGLAQPQPALATFTTHSKPLVSCLMWHTSTSRQHLPARCQPLVAQATRLAGRTLKRHSSGGGAWALRRHRAKLSS